METKNNESPSADEITQNQESNNAESTPDTPVTLEEQLLAKEKEARENWDRFVRERADLDNYRKRVNREKEELLHYGNKSLLEEILPVIDNLERALTHALDDGQGSFVEGIRMTHGMLLAALKKFNVIPIESVGEQFDPAFHQAMAQVPTDDIAPNTVVEEYQKGYLLKDRLLRPAMVTVAAAVK